MPCVGQVHPDHERRGGGWVTDREKKKWKTKGINKEAVVAAISDFGGLINLGWGGDIYFITKGTPTINIRLFRALNNVKKEMKREKKKP